MKRRAEWHRAPRKREETLPRQLVDSMQASMEASVLRDHLFAPFEAPSAALPLRFEGTSSYVSAFVPLLIEEARAGLRNSFEEACSGRKWIQVRVIRIATAVNVLRVQCVATDPNQHGLLEGSCGQIVVFCKDVPPIRDACQWCKVDASRAVAAVASSREDGKAESAREGSWLWLQIPYRNSDDVSRTMKSIAVGQEGWIVRCGNLIVATRERDALAQCSGMPLLPSIMKPRVSKETTPRLDCVPWTTEFLHHVQQAFNPPQQAAIMRACARMDDAPITLVQGPPGTGKTHCVWGILNALHLLHFQEHSDRLMRAVGAIQLDTKTAPKTLLDSALAKVEDYTHSNGYIENLLKNRPRLLVCAPSNAATDVLLERIMKKGCVDGRRNVYFPHVVRVGSTDAPLSKAARDVLLENRVASYMALGLVKVEGEEAHIAGELHKVRMALLDVQGRLSGRASLRGRLPPPVSEEERNALLTQLVSFYQHRDKLEAELARVRIVKTFLMGGLSERKAIMDLEMSIVGDADMVFATLSSSGRNIFGKLLKKFEICVIDEAAQASEVATLQPLQYGCKFCVMVGDPQQLPPTILSKEAQELLYERSMFERLQKAGMEPILLSIQYRMHPEIRSFPSEYFYGGRLQDCPGILPLTQETFHNDPLLKPYLFYDVPDGQEQHRNRGSLQNKLEAEVVISLYRHLRKIEPQASHVLDVSFNAVTKKPATVLILTPYRAQKELLVGMFQHLVGEAALGSLVKIETVDAFQGQEQDIVIFCCVRTSPGGRVGFVNDIRRMNVALTRAKKSLWIVGCGPALSQAPGGHWSALLQDVTRRGLIVKPKTVKALVSSMKATDKFLDAKKAAK